jgi:hypothetical protein
MDEERISEALDSSCAIGASEVPEAAPKRQKPGPRGPRRDPRFQPFPLEIARALAKRAAQLYKSQRHHHPRTVNPCYLCTHEHRIETDTQLLVDAPITVLRESLKKDYLNPFTWTMARFRKHRDKHLMPLVESEIKVGVMMLRSLPFPRDGTPSEKALWYLYQAYALYNEAIAKSDGPFALRCLGEMRKIDFELPVGVSTRNFEIMGLPAPPLPPRPAPDPEKLQNAFKLSRIRKEDYGPGRIDDDDEPDEA